MRRQILAGLGMVLVFTILTGLAYPLAITGIAQAIFPDQANGSLLERDGQVVGSRLIAQPFTEPEYFHPRPSAIDYDATDSGGANWGPTNPDLLAAVEANAQAYREENNLSPDDAVPVDAVTMSSSGLDPHISIANARIQAERIAEAAWPLRTSIGWSTSIPTAGLSASLAKPASTCSRSTSRSVVASMAVWQTTAAC